MRCDFRVYITAFLHFNNGMTSLPMNAIRDVYPAIRSLFLMDKKLENYITASEHFSV